MQGTTAEPGLVAYWQPPSRATTQVRWLIVYVMLQAPVPGNLEVDRPRSAHPKNHRGRSSNRSRGEFRGALLREDPEHQSVCGEASETIRALAKSHAGRSALNSLHNTSCDLAWHLE